MKNTRSSVSRRVSLEIVYLSFTVEGRILVNFRRVMCTSSGIKKLSECSGRGNGWNDCNRIRYCKVSVGAKQVTWTVKVQGLLLFFDTLTY